MKAPNTTHDFVRDGLQNEKLPISTDVKVEFINRLTSAGDEL